MAIGVKAQTSVWDGDVNSNFEQAGNYQDDMAPDAATVVELPTSGGTITFNGADSVLGLVFDGGGQWNFNNGSGSPSLTIGSSGITPAEGVTNIVVFIDVPIVLGADQTWNGSSNAFLFTSGVVSGNHALTIQGRVYLTGADTFTGGVTVANGGTLNIGNAAAAGTGTIQVQNGGTINSYSGAYTVPNTVGFNDGATLVTDAPSDTLNFSGTVNFGDSFTQLNFGGSTAITFSGPVVGPGAGTLSLSGEGARLPVDGGSQLVMTGQLSGVQSLNLTNLQLILAPTGDPTAALGSLNTSALSTSSAYLGLGGTFANEGQLSAFLSTYGELGGNIDGSIGLDHIGNGGTFSDPIDLSGFTSEGFKGLGTSTAVTVTGAITPSFDSNYIFGGGGGVMKVTSTLDDDMPGTSLTMAGAAAPLTLILQGELAFTGGVFSNGGVLIFDTPTAQAAGSLSLSGGYVGYTSNATDITSPATFVSLLQGVPNGVIGFDTDDLEVPANVTQAINLSALNEGSNLFLGTATAANISGVITPMPNDRYQFTGVKGGVLKVTSTLSGSNELVVGLPDPIESGGSVSEVDLGGINSFTGGTTLNSGILGVLTDTALGTGDVVVPATSGAPAPVLTAPGSAVNLANNFYVANNNSGYSPGLVLGSPTTSAMLTLSGNIADYTTDPEVAGYLEIDGNVTLAGNNTYSGGTVFNGTGSPSLTLGSSTALGTGTLTAMVDGTLLAGAASVTVNNAIVLNHSLTIGAEGNTNTLILNGDISGSSQLTILSPVDIPNANPDLSGEVSIQNTVVTIGNELSLGIGQLTTSNSTVTLGIPNPTIENLSGDSASVIGLESGAVLTLDTTNSLEEFDGSIAGDGTNLVMKTGGGAEYLTGTSTFGSGLQVNVGTMIAGSPTALGTGAIAVGSGATLATSPGVTLTNDLTLSAGSILAGAGTFSPPSGVVLSNGITASPGNPALGYSYGTLSFTNGLTFGVAGGYNFNVGTAAGVAGTDYSTLNVTGGLTITAIPTAPFTIFVGTVDPVSGEPGLAVFNPMQAYSWTLLSADSITGFAANKFVLNTSGFENSFPGGSTFTIAQAGNDLVLDFTPVPEPSTWALLLGGVLVVGWGLRRRRRAA